MKAYVLTTGVVFALIVLAHVGRLFAEGVALLKEPVFAVTSVLSIALSVWAWRVLSKIDHIHEKRVS
jgi:hypothetical protein